MISFIKNLFEKLSVIFNIANKNKSIFNSSLKHSPINHGGNQQVNYNDYNSKGGFPYLKIDTLAPEEKCKDIKIELRNKSSDLLTNIRLAIPDLKITKNLEQDIGPYETKNTLIEYNNEFINSDNTLVGLLEYEDSKRKQHRFHFDVKIHYHKGQNCYFIEYFTNQKYYPYEPDINFI